MFDMLSMLGKMKEVQAKLKEAQDTMGELRATGEAGGGMVKVTVNGLKRVLKLEIDPDLLNPQDAEIVQELVAGAINNAFENIEGDSRAHLQKATEGMLPPGMDLGKMFS
jgi:nucleoid-associated protein EbfC